MTKLISGMMLFAAGLGAQGLEAFQPAAPQVFEFRNGVMVGGTYLGVNLAEVDADRSKELKLGTPSGVEITRVEEGSPAEKAGLKTNDVVLEYNGQHVDGMEQFGRLVRETPSGRDVKLLISRNGSTMTVSATTATRKVRTVSAGNMKELFPNVDMPEFHMPDMPQVFTTYRSGMLGVETETLGAQLSAFFGVKEGVLVRTVVKDSAAEKGGIKAGDVITKVEGAKVATPNELAGAVRSNTSKKTFSLELVRDHKEMAVSVTIEDTRPEHAAPRARVIHN